MTRRKGAAGWALGVFLSAAVMGGGLTLTLTETAKADAWLQEYAAAMHPGWNLGNSFDATGAETAWGNPRTTQALIDAIAEAGFKSIRIPVTWGHRMGGPPDYQIQPAFLERVQEVVDWSLQAGLYVMLNMHHDSSTWLLHMAEDREGSLARFEAAWRQIAEHFKEHPHRLSFEGLNEPRFSSDWNEDRPLYFEMLRELDAAFHRVVRSSGGLNATRPIVLSTLTGSPSQRRVNELQRTIEELGDDRVIATVHYYGYYPFSVNVAGGIRFDRQAVNDLTAAFNRVHSAFVQRGVPVVVGEFGLLGFDRSVDVIQRGEMLKFFEFVTHYAREKNMPLMLWDNGQHFDRRALAWRDPKLHEIIMASLSSRSSTTELDSIFFRKEEAKAGLRMRVNLNGNELVEIRQGSALLVPGADYVFEGGILYLRPEYVERLFSAQGDDRFGTLATLTLKFSAGADWDLHLIHYDRPKLSDVVGASIAFAIPAEFNGDQLATMEAVYATGGNAGPADWTPYKEFGYAFQPEYGKGEIRLTREFFNEVRDGEILLRFHFWSGEKVEYALHKEGVRVSGRAR